MRRAFLLFALLLAIPAMAQGILSVVTEASLPKPLGEPPPRWEEVIQEGLFMAVLEAAHRLGAGEGVEEALRERYSSFVVSFRILGRWDFPFEREVRLEVGVNKEGLLEFLASRGMVGEKGERYLVTVKGIADYGQVEAIEGRLGGSPAVLAFALKRATRGAFTWEVLLREGEGLEEVFSGLPLRKEGGKGKEVTLRWEVGHEGP